MKWKQRSTSLQPSLQSKVYRANFSQEKHPPTRQLYVTRDKLVLIANRRAPSKDCSLGTDEPDRIHAITTTRMRRKPRCLKQNPRKQCIRRRARTCQRWALSHPPSCRVSQVQLDWFGRVSLSSCMLGLLNLLIRKLGCRWSTMMSSLFHHLTFWSLKAIY